MADFLHRLHRLRAPLLARRPDDRFPDDSDRARPRAPTALAVSAGARNDRARRHHLRGARHHEEVLGACMVAGRRPVPGPARARVCRSLAELHLPRLARWDRAEPGDPPMDRGAGLVVQRTSRVRPLQRPLLPPRLREHLGDASGRQAAQAHPPGREQPLLAPRGTKLAFVRPRSRRGVVRRDIYIVRRDGRGLRRLTRRGGDSPSWSRMADGSPSSEMATSTWFAAPAAASAAWWTRHPQTSRSRPWRHWTGSLCHDASPTETDPH